MTYTDAQDHTYLRKKTRRDLSNSYWVSAELSYVPWKYLELK